jgi:hypothetical protein
MSNKVCTIRGLELRRAEDGHWLEFTASGGRHSLINIEGMFGRAILADTIIRQWATEQIPIDEVPPQEERR